MARNPMSEGAGRGQAALASALAWPRSIAAYAFLALYVLLVGPPVLAAAVLLRKPTLPIPVGVAAARVARMMFGLRYRIEGLPLVDADRPAVYCMNHASNVDVLVFEILYRRCPRLKGLYKAELGRIPVLGAALTVVGFVPLDRGNRDQTHRAIERATGMLRRGHSFLVAPEGTRSSTGALLPFKRGGFVMAVGAQVPVVPIAVSGGRAAMPRGSAVVRPGVLDVRIGESVVTSGMTMDDLDGLIAEVRARIEQMLTDPPALTPDS